MPYKDWKILGMIYQKKHELKKIAVSVMIAFLLFCLGISSIIRANYNYIDDIGRVVYGYRRWDELSRFLSDYLSILIYGDKYLGDASPLPQIIGTFFLGVAGTIVIWAISENTEFFIIKLFSIVPMGLSPYFLECLSYKFDAPYMALSILLAVLPMMFVKKKSYVYVVSVFFGTVAVCTTYQAGLGIFPMLVVLRCLQKWNLGERWRPTFLFCCKSVSGYFMAILFFRFFIMRPIKGYMSNVIPSLNGMVSNTFSNYKKYYAYVINDFNSKWMMLILILFAGFLFLVVKDSKQNKLNAFLWDYFHWHL